MRRWIAILGFVSLSFSTLMAQAPKGVVRVSVRVAESQTPIPGAQLTLVPWLDCGDCLLDLPDNEEDLLAYLTVLASQRGIYDGVLLGGGPVRTPSQPNPALLKSKGFVTAITDAEGNAIFPNLAQGTYQVSVQREGYLGRTPPFRGFVGGVMPLASSPPIAIDPENLAPQVLLALIPFGSVSGHVRDAGGDPVPGAIVVLGNITSEAGHRAQIFGKSTTTNAAGEYHLAGLGPGAYVIQVLRTSTEAKPVYFPATPDLERASLVTLDAGKSLTGIDVKLPEAP